jgi:hypothetical protein
MEYLLLILVNAISLRKQNKKSAISQLGDESTIFGG